MRLLLRVYEDKIVKRSFAVFPRDCSVALTSVGSMERKREGTTRWNDGSLKLSKSLLKIQRLCVEENEIHERVGRGGT